MMGSGGAARDEPAVPRRFRWVWFVDMLGMPVIGRLKFALGPATALMGDGAETKMSCEPAGCKSVSTDTSGTVSDERRFGVISGSVGMDASVGERVSN